MRWVHLCCTHLRAFAGAEAGQWSSAVTNMGGGHQWLPAWEDEGWNVLALRQLAIGAANTTQMEHWSNPFCSGSRLTQAGCAPLLGPRCAVWAAAMVSKCLPSHMDDSSSWRQFPCCSRIQPLQAMRGDCGRKPGSKTLIWVIWVTCKIHLTKIWLSSWRGLDGCFVAVVSSFSSIFSFSSQLCNECFPCFTSPAFQTARAPVHAHTQIDVFPIFTFSPPPSQYSSTFILPVSLSTPMICAYSQVLVAGSGWGAQPQPLQWNKSVVGLFTAVQKSELQMLPFEISFHLCIEPWAPGFVLYFTILSTFYLFLSSKGASHNAGGGSIS